MPRSVSNAQFKKMVFKPIPMDQVWIDTFGELEEGFSMAVWGSTGQGKTTLVLTWLKHLSETGKVYYNSHEQGMVGSLRKAAHRLGVLDLPSEKWIWGNMDSVDEMEKKVKNNGARYIVVDSRDSINLTVDKWLKMHKQNQKYKNKKSIIVICWGKNEDPKSEHSKGIAFLSDVKVAVYNHATDVNSRFGPTKPYHIFGKPKTPNGRTLPLGI